MLRQGQGCAIRLSSILLLLVMGGRTALFVSKLDSLLPLTPYVGVRLTPLSIIFAIALILAVYGASRVRAAEVKTSRKRRTANAVVWIAAVADGWFNISEAIYLADEAGVFSQFTGITLAWMWGTAFLVGIAPTALVVGLASLQGEGDKSQGNRSGSQSGRSANAEQSQSKSAATVERDCDRCGRTFSAQSERGLTNALNAHQRYCKRQPAQVAVGPTKEQVAGVGRK